MNIGVFFIQSAGQTPVIFQTVIVLATKNQLNGRSDGILKIGIIPIYGDRGIFNTSLLTIVTFKHQNPPRPNITPLQNHPTADLQIGYTHSVSYIKVLTIFSPSHPAMNI
jgi:hypothetical protein